jgi:hypothetical protein
MERALFETRRVNKAPDTGVYRIPQTPTMTTNLDQEERTDRTDFGLYRDEDGRLFLKIFTGKVYYMVELDENELARLRERLTKPPLPIDM